MNIQEKHKLWTHYIDALHTEAVGLTKWEENFVESVAEQLTTKGSLSPRQEEILERIYAERTR